MQGQRTIDGKLRIKRGDRFLTQKCKAEIFDYCCDACPMFGEPQQHIDGPNYLEHTRKQLQICENRTLVFDEFEDER